MGEGGRIPTLSTDPKVITGREKTNTKRKSKKIFSEEGGHGGGWEGCRNRILDQQHQPRGLPMRGVDTAEGVEEKEVSGRSKSTSLYLKWAWVAVLFGGGT